jgi:toxin-antitoxin system PIN domain toxin
VTHLLDGNVLVAIAVADHVHHAPVSGWYASSGGPIATCPITEGTLVRFLLRAGFDAPSALGVLRAITVVERHRFWPDDVALASVSMRGVIGHRQVTDAYLAGLARRHGGRVLTLDRGFAALHGDVVDLLA